MKKFALLFTGFFLCLLLSCTDRNPKADRIILNADIWTGDQSNPSAQAMAIAGDSLLAVVSNAEIEKYIGPNTEVIDLNGAFVTPGFIDSHVHFLMGGFNLSGVQLRDAKTKEEFISRIKAFAETVPAGTWILGGDWDHENWGGELPTRQWIDAVTPDHPVWITRLDGHMSLANTAALTAAGVDRAVKDVEGGTIVRDANGNLTGIFKDNATNIVDRHVPEPSPEQVDNALQAAMKYVASFGVTSVHHMAGHIDALERARKSNNMITRIYAMYPISQWEVLNEKIAREGRGDKWLKVGGLKGFVDGSLGSHTAAFFEPFTDAPSDTGLWVNTPEQLYTWISAADKAGLQLMVHAIGDRAINTLLNIYERVERENGSKDRRFRIEHAQHIAHQDIPRFAALNVIPSMQPYHAIDDGRWAEKVIGPERIKTTYAFKSLFDAGAMVAFGSDWFVAPPTPLEGIYAAVTRRTLDDQNPDGWVPEQKITVEQALIAYTRNAAYASFDEKLKGTLTPGKLADFVVLSEDLRTVAPDQIRNVRVLNTWVGGKEVFRAE
ncbi:MAG: amidohydrolase family protein [Cyclobacteriaceae bacterium]|nr:MAG: amidohydrolase family protein [Cyclobacteriaceae bacterium]